MYNDLTALGGRILATARTGRIDPTKPASASELLQDMITNDPAARALINRDPSNTAWLMQFITSAGKAQ